MAGRSRLPVHITVLLLISVAVKIAGEPTAVLVAQHLQQGLRLLQQTDTDPTAECSNQLVSYLLIDGLALPTGSFTVATTVALVSTPQAAQQGDNILLTAAGLTASLNRLQGTLTLATRNGFWAKYYLRVVNTTISLSVDGQQRLRMCFDLACPTPASVTGFTQGTDGWLVLPDVSAAELKLFNITLGSRSQATSVDAWIQDLWVAPVALDIATAASAATTAAQYYTANTVTPAMPPALRMDPLSSNVLTSLSVGGPVNVAVTATSAASRIGLKLRLTFYGVAPSECATSSCGDVSREFFQEGSVVQGTATVTYQRPGRYIIRAQASDMLGGWTSEDYEVLVRKVGDAQGRAPCCRTTANIIAQQLGRPVDPYSFRPSWINSSAAAVGWDWDYLLGPEDLEAERLFDYGLLAPVDSGPVTMITCPDSYLAGPGSPSVHGINDIGNINAESNQGHAKRVAIVPQGFNWAATAGLSTSDLPCCVTHWTSWVSSTPYGKLTAGTKTASCSYTCTPEGVRQLVTQAGTFDRWAEAVIENTYGRVSFLHDPVILPTIYMPQKAAAGDTAFSYSEAPIYDYMQGLGFDMQVDFHTVLVLSPRPNFINSGITAWAKADGSPLLFVMRCNPQHYYLVHEEGHRLGMPHATLFKMDAGPQAQAPTSPLGPGIMQDTYSDRLDIMACCKGDYSLHNRILSGWLPASERVTLGLLDIATPTTPTSAAGSAANSSEVVRHFVLWPYDRPESKGQLKGVSLRLEDGKVLVLGYRSTPFWQDVRIGLNNSRPYSNDRLVQPEHMRDNVAGLSVEYSKRYLDAAGASQWSVRGLLDFNLAFMRFPDALPIDPGSYPPNPPGASFTLLREGDAWLDEQHNLLIAVERVATCTDQPLVPVYHYGVYNFYGFRGEDPGTESVERADYTGYASGIRCLQLRVVTGVTSAPGTLDVRVRMQGMDEQNRLVLGGSQCGFPVRPRLKLELPAGADILAIVWRDNINRTVASDLLEVELPPLAPLAEASVPDTQRCNSACDWQYHVKVLAADGAQTQLDIAIGSVSLSMLTMTVTYSYYLRRSILTAAETHSIPVVQQAPTQSHSPQGRQLLDQPTALEAVAQTTFVASSLPDFSCSQQWSVTIQLVVPSSFLTAADGSSRQVQLLTVLSNTDTDAGWPALLLKVSPQGTSIIVQWGSTSNSKREQAATFNADSSTQLAVVRDDVRLGVWVNSAGSWLIDDVGCIPDRQAVNYCDKAMGTSSAGASFTSLRVGSTSSSTGIIVESIRVYNYALPRLSQAKESLCADDGSCGRFLLAGWQPPAVDLVPAGAIDLHGVVPSVASTRISLQSNSYYLMVGAWSECSALCGGGWQSRDVRCMLLSADPSAPVSQVPLEDCPLGEEIPSSSKRCNTVSCPQHSLQLLASKHSSCSRDCHLLGTQLDAAQLVCINSLGQPHPLRQCCILCNATDWSSIPWSSSFSTLMHVSSFMLGSDVAVLQPANIAENSSLGQVLDSGILASACESGQFCSADARWQLSSWSSCSKTCGGGQKTRTASCVNAQTGAAVSDGLCQQVAGAVPSELLSAPCRTVPCIIYTWKLGDWSTCSGDADYGHSSRSVSCMDDSGARARAGASACPSAAPSSTAVCLRVTQSAVCRPGFIAEEVYGKKDCYGHGTCTMLGCSCTEGWHGQFCEMAASCKGVMTKFDKCCASGVLDSQGACCSAGSVLDNQGQCCEGAVDVCGVCRGASWSIDITGTCCNGVLDALGSCCASGALDECGVCDGDGTSCKLLLRLLAQLPVSSNITAVYEPAAGDTGSAPTWQLALLQLLNTALLQQSVDVQLQVQQVAAVWSPEEVTAATKTAPPHATRLLLADISNHKHSCQESSQCSPRLASVLQTLNTKCQHVTTAEADGSCSQNTQQDAESNVLSSAATRRLLDSTVWQAAYLEVVLMPTRKEVNPAGSSTAAPGGALGLSTAAVGAVLVSEIEKQAAASTSGVAGSSGSTSITVDSDPQPLRLLQMLMVERAGVCGNGICEVGERALLMADASTLQQATSPCPEDCPLSFMVCPAPVGVVGDSSLECGGHGRCIRTQGVCDCFAGYTGNACEQCVAGFYPHASWCVPQFITGRTIFDRFVDEEQQQKKFAGTIFLVIGGIAAACALASLSWVLYRWLVLGHTPKAALVLQRLLRGTQAAGKPGTSQKYLLDDELELSTGPMRGTRPVIEDASVWSKQGAVRRRNSSAAAIGGSGTDEWDGDLLKAIRAHLTESPEQDHLPVSTPTRSRLSRLTGRGGGSSSSSSGGTLSGFIGRIASSAGGSRRGYSSLGEADTGEADKVQQGPAAPGVQLRNSMTFEQVFNSLQLGISSAGGGAIRVLSEGVSRLSSRGAGYERMSTDSEGLLVVDDPTAQQQQRLNSRQEARGNIGMSPSAASLDFPQDAVDAESQAEPVDGGQQERASQSHSATAAANRTDASLASIRGLAGTRTRIASRQLTSGAMEAAAATGLSEGTWSGPPAPAAAALTKPEPRAARHSAAPAEQESGQTLPK